MLALKDIIKKAVTNLPSKQDLKEADEDTAVIVLSQGILADGDSYYAYVAIEPSKYVEFKKAETSGKPYKLSDYGTIIKWERKAAPTNEVMDDMELRLGLDHQYEEKVVKAVKELQEEA